MRIKKSIFVLIASLLLFKLSCTETFALEIEDGFGLSKKIEGRHFVIYYHPEIDIQFLSRQLNIHPAEELLVDKAYSKSNHSFLPLADMLDTLFLRICNILDMPLYSFQGNIKICQDSAHLKRVYRNIFGKEMEGSAPFYVYAINTVYISADDFKVAVLGHELAHMVISHYFVVQPSVKIQEILAGYVEYQLRKFYK
ncbi:MAG: hypothetical protein NC826_03780 [Candidatus Omnitrophica bacterium]|nr:hypothetical protein [Candidatus Omnitrophota bacterium]